MQPPLEPEPVPTAAGAGAAIMCRAEDLMGIMWPWHLFFPKFLEPQSSLSDTALGLLTQGGKAQICSRRSCLGITIPHYLSMRPLLFSSKRSFVWFSLIRFGNGLS